MVVSFYLGINHGPSVNASRIENGNPGVGGTQYCMIELAHYLNTVTDFKINIIAYREYLVEDGISYSHIDSEKDVCGNAIALKTDILVTRVPQDPKFREILDNCNLKVVIWSHNFLSSNECDYISQSKTIVANVFVGKRVYDFYIDDDVIKKSTYIYNMYYELPLPKRTDYNSNAIAFMGYIGEYKGFLEMAEMWPYIKANIPDAQLYVLGSALLYGDKKLGPLNIADEQYERKILKYIVDKEGRIDPSIHFLGVVGTGKYDIFQRCNVGVVNPSGEKETFGMSILEMANAGLPVCTRRVAGYMDTVENGKTGYLSENLKGVSDNIIKLLRNHDECSRLGTNARSRLPEFSSERIGRQWVDLLRSINEEKWVSKKLKPSYPLTCKSIFVSHINSFFRFNLHLRFLPSCVEFKSWIHKHKK